MKNLPEAGGDEPLVADDSHRAAMPDLHAASALAHAAGSAAQLAGAASPQLAAATQAIDSIAALSSLAEHRSPVDLSSFDEGFDPHGLDLGAATQSLSSLSSLASAAGVASPALAEAAKAAQFLQSAKALASTLDPTSAESVVAHARESMAAMPTETPAVAEAAQALAEPEVSEEEAAAGDGAREMPAYNLPGEFTPPAFDDSSRTYRLYTLLPENKRLFVHAFKGVEAFNEDFEFEVDLASLNAHIELKEVMTKPMVVAIKQTDGSERYVSGYVAAFRFVKSDAGWAFYRARLVPWTYFLTRNKDSRIFQQKNVRQVLEDIFGEYGGMVDYDFRLVNSYEPEDFIVQYQQSDAHFINHLIEREGWTTYFEHRIDGHTLVITDDTASLAYCKPLSVYPTIEFNGGSRVTPLNSVDHFEARREFQPGKYTVDTYDFKQPSGTRMAEVPTVADQGEVPQVEVYDGTPSYAYKNRAEGDRYARLRMERFEAAAKHFHGRSDCPDLFAGGSTILVDHFWFDSKDADENRLLITRVVHEGRNNLLDKEEAFYRNHFDCQRQKVAYRPPLKHERATIPGLQTATVTGPKGHEIWVNKHGCIKVRFHWDRRAKFDDSSSCWIRVAQPWAGKGWGSVAIPRVGQEVVVGFLEGDPSRPMILSSVYNGEQTVPYGLPDGAHMMGLRSNSTPGGGGYCEIVLHDRKGKELINIHSQRDMIRTVQNNDATIVNGPQQSTVVTKGKQETIVKQQISIASLDADISVTAKTKITLRTGKASIEMFEDGLIVIDGRQVIVKGSQSIDLNPPGGDDSAQQPAPPPSDDMMAAAGGAGGGGSGGGGGAPLAAKPAGGGNHAAKGASAAPAAPAVKTGLGDKVDAIVAKSPTLQNDYKSLKDKGWNVVWGPKGGGTYANRQTKVVTVDSGEKDNPAAVAQSLSHEFGHAQYDYVEDLSTKDAYVKGALADEGAATMNNIKVRREIRANGGPDIGIAGNPKNQPAYNKAYDKYLKDGDAGAARNAIGAIYGAGEKTSNTNQPYANYYGSWYDNNIAPPGH
jgi:type VI secretion system secreted protein VgrG